ncbi:Microtubule-associated proteins 1A/1B light chain 3C [Gryllus bimaculatus]|nr:Microtubule-associated proteins 1A/1B light chain 3C [Gryllus bimaculatus]
MGARNVSATARAWWRRVAASAAASRERQRCAASVGRARSRLPAGDRIRAPRRCCPPPPPPATPPAMDVQAKAAEALNIKKHIKHRKAIGIDFNIKEKAYILFFVVLASRREEVLAIRSKFPNKVPVIVERFYKEQNLPTLDKRKFLVPQEITMSQFVTIIRNRMKLGSTQAFYLLVRNRSMISLSRTLAEVYSEYRDEDGFLYVTYASQEVFGSDNTGP